MEQIFSHLKINTFGEGFTNITGEINKFLKKNKLYTGMIILSSSHTSCSLIVNENADPNVLIDLQNYIKAIVPNNSFFDLKKNKEIFYEHYQEGIDDMPAHIKTALTNTSLSFSFKDHKLILGMWQAIYLWEHRIDKKLRILNIHAIGDKK